MSALLRIYISLLQHQGLVFSANLKPSLIHQFVRIKTSLNLRLKVKPDPHLQQSTEPNLKSVRCSANVDAQANSKIKQKKFNV